MTAAKPRSIVHSLEAQDTSISSTAPTARPDGAVHDVVWALHDLASASAEYDAHLANQLGVSATELVALKHLLVERGERDLGPVELARLLGMSSGSATTLLHRLEAQGHVHREPHPTDRRRRRLTVAPDTVARVIDALDPAADGITLASRTLTPDQRGAVVAFLQQVATEYRRNAAS